MIGSELIYFYIAFDKTTNTEYLLYKDMIHKGNIYYSEPMSKCLIVPIGTFLLNFLNTDFEGTGIGHFIRKYCYESIYFLKYPEKKKDGLNFVHLELNEHDYLLNLFQFMKSEKNDLNYSNLSEINGLINDISLEFTFGAYYLSGINLSIHNIPYCFYSSDIGSILAIELKELSFLSMLFHK